MSTQLDSWTDRLVKQSIGIRQAERLLGASGAHRRGRLVERLVRKQQDGTLGQPGGPDASEADEMIQVGDNHYTALPAAAGGGTGGLGTALALGAGLLAASGAGVGGAMWLLADRVTEPTPSVAPANPGPDTDTRYRLRLVD